MYAAGSNSDGQLGTRNNKKDIAGFTEILDGTSTPFASSSIGGRHALFLTPTAEIYGAGDHRQGQLPTPPITDEEQSIHKIDYVDLVSKIWNVDQDFKDKLAAKYQPRQVIATWETSLIVLSCTLQEEDDCIIAFGSNDFGVKGVLLNHLEPNLIELPHRQDRIGKRKIRVHAGNRHVIAVVVYAGNSDIELVGWGSCRHGQLGINPPIHTKSILPSVLLQIPPSTPPDSILIALGNSHSIIIIKPDKVYAWGNNKNGQLHPSISDFSPSDVLEVRATWNNTFFILQNAQKEGHKRLVGFGSNKYGQLQNDNNSGILDILIPDNFKDMRTGSEHILITKKGNEEEEVWGWGWNEHGNLSDNSLPIIPFQLLFKVPSHLELVDVAAGCATSFIFCVSKLK
ncbi:hypothetical protein MJO29_010409 [Puccinia striiformis f. sp. tritici]|nr:hypothetical protein Pst134EB_020367 [Puccinia striiformis f. sp. tritici]KAI7948744.1 hypothetical protein MJO29_010409 [Puccinia striiformis f. sp. tritici]